MAYLKELQGKGVHDHFNNSKIVVMSSSEKCVRFPGAVIVGAGPSGLATAACLKQRGVPSLIIERYSCIAPLWQLKTYDRLCLHLPKQFCELPLMSFPTNFPSYPTKEQFVAYLEDYKTQFSLEPVYNRTVVSAEFDDQCGLWRVKTVQCPTSEDGVYEGVKITTKILGMKQEEKTEYVCQWLIVATGENAEKVEPQIEGREDFVGPVFHTSKYKSGDSFDGKKVLVVGCGNSGMEVSLDLCNFNAHPSIVVRDSVHVLPQEMLGRSTFGLSMCLLKWLPIRLVDQFLLLISWFMLGNTAQLGLARPELGPLELKKLSGKTPVLDVGTLSKIRSGNIKVFPGIKRLMRHSVEFVDGRVENFEAIILATGYRSNVPSWLKGSDMFSDKDGLPLNGFPEGWKGKCGLYAVGFTKRGLLGTSMDATRIAQDIEHLWKAEPAHFMSFARAPQLEQSQNCKKEKVN